MAIRLPAPQPDQLMSLPPRRPSYQRADLGADIPGQVQSGRLRFSKGIEQMSAGMREASEGRKAYGAGQIAMGRGQQELAAGMAAAGHGMVAKGAGQIAYGRGREAEGAGIIKYGAGQMARGQGEGELGMSMSRAANITRGGEAMVEHGMEQLSRGLMMAGTQLGDFFEREQLKADDASAWEAVNDAHEWKLSSHDAGFMKTKGKEAFTLDDGSEQARSAVDAHLTNFKEFLSSRRENLPNDRARMMFDRRIAGLRNQVEQQATDHSLKQMDLYQLETSNRAREMAMASAAATASDPMYQQPGMMPKMLDAIANERRTVEWVTTRQEMNKLGVKVNPDGSLPPAAAEAIKAAVLDANTVFTGRIVESLAQTNPIMANAILQQERALKRVNEASEPFERAQRAIMPNIMAAEVQNTVRLANEKFPGNVLAQTDWVLKESGVNPLVAKQALPELHTMDNLRKNAEHDSMVKSVGVLNGIMNNIFIQSGGMGRIKFADIMANPEWLKLPDAGRVLVQHEYERLQGAQRAIESAGRAAWNDEVKDAKGAAKEWFMGLPLSQRATYGQDKQTFEELQNIAKVLGRRDEVSPAVSHYIKTELVPQAMKELADASKKGTSVVNDDDIGREASLWADKMGVTDKTQVRRFVGAVRQNVIDLSTKEGRRDEALMRDPATLNRAIDKAVTNFKEKGWFWNSAIPQYQYRSGNAELVRDEATGQPVEAADQTKRERFRAEQPLSRFKATSLDQIRDADKVVPEIIKAFKSEKFEFNTQRELEDEILRYYNSKRGVTE